MAKVSGAVIIELDRHAHVQNFTVGNNNSITKGDLLFLVDPKTVSGANLTNTAAAGIAAADKELGDGSTTIPVYTDGVFDIVAGAAGFNAGALLKISGGNYIVTGTSDNFMSGLMLCKALETATAEEYVACKLLGF